MVTVSSPKEEIGFISKTMRAMHGGRFGELPSSIWSKLYNAVEKEYDHKTAELIM